MKSATIRDVARAANVSVATVSRALNRGETVSMPTRVRVLDAAGALDYVPHSGARSLSTSRTDTIGVLLPDLHGEFFSELIRGIDQATRAHKLHLLLSHSHGDPQEAMAVLKAMQEGRLGLDVDINTLLKSWQLPGDGFTNHRPVTPRSLLSHTSGTSDGFGFPGYSPSEPRPTLVQILNGDKPSNVGKVRLERPPLTGFQYSGGGVTIMQLALTDVIGKSYSDIVQGWVLGPIGMTRSGYDQPLQPGRDATAARAHDGRGKARDAKWHVYPELAAAGLWTTPTDLAKFALELQLSLHGRSNKVLSQATAREMITPVGVGPFAVGFAVTQQGEGWYFAHSGGNWGFACNLTAHTLKGYGLAVMTNSDTGGRLIEEVRSRVATAYGWDWIDKPIPR